MEESCVIIPGLPEEVAMLCLARLPARSYPVLSCVCRSWRRAFQLPLLFHIRSRLGLQEHFLFFTEPAERSQHSSSNSTQFHLMDCRLAKCYPLPPPPPPPVCAHRYRYNVISLGRQVFILPVCGCLSQICRGLSPDCPESWEPLCFDVVLRRWCTQPPPMLESRTMFASATVDGYVYAAGGLHLSSLKSTERFHLASKKWARIADMREKRFGASGVSWKGSFCVLGGWNYELSQRFYSAEVWDALKEEWHLIPDFLPFLYMKGAATVKGKLYVLRDAYTDHRRRVRVVMLLDEKRNRWIQLGSLEDALLKYAPDFSYPSSLCTMIEVGDELWILVVAGYKCVLFATDPESLPLCWRCLPFEFFTNKSDVCVVTI